MRSSYSTVRVDDSSPSIHTTASSPWISRILSCAVIPSMMTESPTINTPSGGPLSRARTMASRNACSRSCANGSSSMSSWIMLRDLASNQCALRNAEAADDDRVAFDELFAAESLLDLAPAHDTVIEDDAGVRFMRRIEHSCVEAR